jgi:DNA-binding XRE family transcriptional regulator
MRGKIQDHNDRWWSGFVAAATISPVDKDRDLVALGRNIRRLRSERELTQEELASRAGLSANYVGEIERGMRNPSVKVLFDLARALTRPPATLLEGIER